MTTDTIMTTPAPAYVQIHDQNRGYSQRGHDWDGVTVKDRIHSSTDALNHTLANMNSNTLANFTATQVAVERNGRSAELATEKTGAAGILETEKNGAAIQLANALAFANTQNLLISGFKDGRYDAAVNTAAIQAKVAEICCCVKEDGELTRTLINALNTHNIEAQLADAKNQVTLLQLKAKV